MANRLFDLLVYATQIDIEDVAYVSNKVGAVHRVIVKDRNGPGRLVRNVHLMALFHKTDERTAEILA